MATVPIYQQTERLAPNNRQGLTSQASPDDFGAAIGRSMGAVAQGVDNVGAAFAQVKAKEAETEVKDRDNLNAEKGRDALYNAQTGFLMQEGKNAVDAWGGFQKRVDEILEEGGKGLAGEAAEMYSRASAARRNSMLQQGIVHMGSERKVWFKTTSDSRLNTFQEDAIAGYKDPKLVDTQIGAGLAELRNRAQDEGWDADTFKNKGAEYVSTVRRGVLTRMVEDDAIAAEKYFNDHKDQFTGPDQYAIGKAMKEGLIVEKSKREAASILESAATPTDEGVGGPRIVGGGELTLSMIRKAEGFRSTPYWDVNHYRVGFGSDTVTRADGTVVRTTPGTKISLADGERDLQRRVAEFQSGIMSKVGAENWRGLTGQAQAALTSVAYNYGELPDSVASAVKSGDQSAIASSVRALEGHNGGVNKSRRNSEADLIAGVSSGESSGLSYSQIEDRLGKIADPDVREATRTRLNAMMTAQDKQRSAMQKDAEMQIFTAVEQGGTPDDVSIETRLAAGMSSVSSAWSYHEARLKRGEPETDQGLLYQLRRTAASDPIGFADRNLMEYRDRLDNSAFKELTDAQSSALKDQTNAVREGSVYNEAYRQSEQALAAAGLSTTGQRDAGARAAAEMKVAQFQNALKLEIDQFRTQSGKTPTYDETQSLINALLMKSIYSEPRGAYSPMRLFDDGTSQTDGGFMFERGNAPDGATVKPAVEYQQIPAEWQASIKTALTERTGRAPTKQEIEAEYASVVMEILGAN